jgi:5,10-methylenetetrahydromethanopterin reductase
LTAKRSASLLGAYIGPGSAMDAGKIVDEAVEGERIGLGSVWLSELQGPYKDAGATLGYVAHATGTIRLGTSVTHFATRHLMVLASWGATMQALSGGRFEMGFGRSSPSRWEQWGLPAPTIRSMGDDAAVLRKLWRGESVSVDGRFPNLDFGEFPSLDPPPLYLAAIGPKTLQLAGRAFDGVLLHPFLTTEGMSRSREIVRDAAEGAGRDPDAVTIFHQHVIAPDLSEEDTGRAVWTRAAAYFSLPGFGEPILEMNGWDPAPLGPFRRAVGEAMERNAAAGSPLKGRDVLLEPSRLLPPQWIESGAAIGSAADCAKDLERYMDAGADQIILHGATTDRLEKTVKAFAEG